MNYRIYGVFAAVCLCGVAGAQNFTANDDGHQITVADRGQPVLTYVYQAPPDADGAPGKGPANYLHPIYGLYGEQITGDSPSQWSGAPGLHWAWSKVGCDDGVADISAGEGGRRIFERLVSAHEIEAGMELVVQNVWVIGPLEHAQVIESIAFIIGPVKDARRQIDVDVLLRSVSTGKIYLEGSIPGSGLELTLNPERPDWGFTGAGMTLEQSSKPTLAPWIVASYRDDRRSTRSGVAILQDSRNPGFANPNWLVESAERVVGGVPPSVKAELKPGDFLQFRYRMILHHLSGSKMEMTGAYAQFMAEGQQGR